MGTNGHIILYSGQAGIARMLPYDPEGGLTLEDWTPSGLRELTLPPDAVLALLRQLPRELLQEALEDQAPGDPPIWHWAIRPGVAACGIDAPARVTPSPQMITCPECLESWYRLCLPKSEDQRALHVALATKALAALREA